MRYRRAIQERLDLAKIRPPVFRSFGLCAQFPMASAAPVAQAPPADSKPDAPAPKKQPAFWVKTVGAMLGGVVEATTLQPLDVMKVNIF